MGMVSTFGVSMVTSFFLQFVRRRAKNTVIINEKYRIPDKIDVVCSL